MRTQIFSDGFSLNSADVFRIMVNVQAGRVLGEKTQQFLFAACNAPAEKNDGYSCTFQRCKKLICCAKGSVFAGLDADEICTGFNGVLDLIHLSPKAAFCIREPGIGITFRQVCFQCSAKLGRKRIREVREEEKNPGRSGSFRDCCKKAKAYKKKREKLLRSKTSLQSGGMCD